MTNLKEYMNEKRMLNRWLVLLVALSGAFAGVVLMFMFVLAGML